jgi:hypothetical protein
VSTLSVRLPSSLHKQLRECAKREGTSINQLINSAVGEKLAVLMTADYFEMRAKRGNRKKFEAALATIPDVEPDEFDKLPHKSLRRSRRRVAGRRHKLIGRGKGLPRDLSTNPKYMKGFGA